MARKTNHAGTIYQRKDDSWEVRLMLYGQRISYYERTKPEAEEKLKALLREIALHDALPQNRTLSELLDEFLGTVEANLKPRTISDYRKLVALAREMLGNTPLNKLTPSRLQVSYNSLRATPQLAPYFHHIMHRALRLAVNWGWIATNPADKVERPRYRPQEREMWTMA